MQQYNVNRVTRFFLAGLLVALLAPSAFGQLKKYPTMKGAILDAAKVKDARIAAQKAIQAGDTSAAAQKAIETYYCKYVIAGMTSSKAQQSADTLPNFRNQLRQAMSRSKSAQQHRFLLQIFYKYLNHIAFSKNNYSPRRTLQRRPGAGRFKRHRTAPQRSKRNSSKT